MINRLKLLIVLVVSCLYSNAQSIIYNKSTGIVEVPIKTYRLVVQRQQDCDSLSLYNQKLTSNQDSIINLSKIKEQSFKQEINYKDSTITKLTNETNNILKREKENKGLFKNTSIWISGAIGLIFGILLAK